MANKVDYNPDFGRDPKEMLGAHKALLTDQENKQANINPIDRQITDPIVPTAENISSPEDLARFIDDTADKLEQVNDRSIALENALKFDPIALPPEMQVYMNTLGVSTDSTADSTADFTTNNANCCIKVLNYDTNQISKVDVIKNPKVLEEMAKTWFPEWGIKFILILFFMFLKGIVWQLLSTLCRAFRKLRFKIGPFKVCIGCPFANLFKSLVKILNRGYDYKLAYDGSPLLDANGTVQRWQDCPPDFDPYGFNTQNAVTNVFRGGDPQDNSRPQSICETNDAPSPNEREAATALLGYVLKESIKNPTDNNMKAAQYINAKTQSTSYRNTISNALTNTAKANDPKGVIYKIDGISGANKGIAKVQTDIEKAISEYNPSKLVDEASKGMLILVSGMLKVWDTMVSAINKTARISPVTRDLVCCFLNIFGAIFPTFTVDQNISVKKMEGVIDLVITLIDYELDEISTTFELEYFTLNDLSNGIQDAILYSVYATFAPIANGLFEEIKGRFDPVAIKARLIKQSEQLNINVSTDSIPKPKIVEAIENCILFDTFSKNISLKIQDIQISLMQWFIGFKGQNDIKTRKIEGQIQLSSKSKLLFSLKTILKGIMNSVKKDVKLIISICNTDGNISPVDIDNVQSQLDRDIFKKDDISDIPDPVYGPNDIVGLEENDPVDTVFTTGEFYDATYSNMAGYDTGSNLYGTIESTELTDLTRTDKNSMDNTKSETDIDNSNRDCSDSQVLQGIFEELRIPNNLKNTL